MLSMLTKKQFGRELEKQVLSKQSVADIALWVQSVYQEGISDADFNFLDLLLTLSILDGSPDDAYEDEDLLEIAELLMNGQDIQL